MRRNRRQQGLLEQAPAQTLPQRVGLDRMQHVRSYRVLMPS